MEKFIFKILTFGRCTALLGLVSWLSLRPAENFDCEILQACIYIYTHTHNGLANQKAFFFLPFRTKKLRSMDDNDLKG